MKQPEFVDMAQVTCYIFLNALYQNYTTKNTAARAKNRFVFKLHLSVNQDSGERSWALLVSRLIYKVFFSNVCNSQTYLQIVIQCY